MKYVLLVATLVATLAAQEFRGSINGKVVDPTGAAAAGAAIEVRRADTNTVARAEANNTGAYQVPFLSPGDYTVVVEMRGFKKIDRPNVRIATGVPVTLDFTLEVGQTSES